MGNILMELYPFLFPIFFIVFIYIKNRSEIPFIDLLMPVAMVIIITTILGILLYLPIQEYNKVAIIVTGFWLFIFSYGSVRDAIYSSGITHLSFGNLHISNQFILGPIWMLLLIGMTALIVMMDSDWHVVSKFLTVMSIILVIILVFGAILGNRSTHAKESYEKTGEYTFAITKGTPNIYYIILDTYAGNKTLKEAGAYDNSGFVDFLISKGFYVTDNSHSNYDTTLLSMPASLNMDYLSDLEKNSVGMLLNKWEDNRVSKFLKGIGYRYVFIGGGLDPNGMNKYTDANLVYGSKNIFSSSDFSNAVISTTLFAPVVAIFDNFFRSKDRQSRLYAFDELAKLSTDKPAFIYSHIMLPHSPFIFDKDGNPPKQNIFQRMNAVWESNEPTDGYIEQLMFVNNNIEKVIGAILAKAGDSIIILQGDHGIWWSDGSHKFDILNAYYFPDKNYSKLYSTISPVNSFRVIFNQYFGGNFEMLVDRSISR